MASVAEHYRSLLAPVYLWMAGGFEAAVARGQAEIDDICPKLPAGCGVVDLGAGFGMHAIPLARRGCQVLAIDSSPQLLDELQAHAKGLSIRTVVDDLLAFPAHLDSPPELILCMGDTLTHLPDHAAVQRLVAHAATTLQAGGHLIVSFRDYSTALVDAQRFIAVRSDADRILSCFLEYEAEHVNVHDLLHQRVDGEWQMRVSAYRKLRLSPAWLVAVLQERGFVVRTEPGLSGLLRVRATRS